MSLMLLQFGQKALSAYSSYSAQKHSARMLAIQKEFENTMAGFASAQQSNTQTMNEIQTRDAMIRADLAIDVQAMEDKASATAQAAAAGVEGGSVRSTINGLMRSHLQAKAAQNQRRDQQSRANTQARRNIALNRVFGMNRDVIPQPSAASALLGLGASLLDTYDQHQTPGNTTSDEIAEWWA